MYIYKFSTLPVLIFSVLLSIPLSAQFADGKILMQSKGKMAAIETGDLNGDGNLDVVATTVKSIVYYFGDGTGNYGSEQILTVSVGFSPSLSLADTDNDNDLDIIISAGFCNLCIYQNDGQGNFGAPISIEDDMNPLQYLITTDIDEDGDEDIFAGSALDNTLSWYKNLGAGNFAEKEIISNDVDAYFISSYDVQGDGNLDLMVSDFAGGRLVWFAGDGLGSFGAMQIASDAIIYGARSQVITDMNNDGIDDVVLGVWNPNAIVWFAADGDGNFSEPQTITGNSSADIRSIVVEDFNNDNYPDILYTSYDGDKIGLYLAEDYGVYNWESIIASQIYNARGLRVGYYDQDEHLDFIVGYYSGTLRSYFGDGTGSFGNYIRISDPAPYSIGDISAADIDEDGFNDVIISYTQLQPGVPPKFIKLTNIPTEGRFAPEILSEDSTGSEELHIVDLNNDGHLDLINNSHLAPFIEWASGNGDGTFNQQSNIVETQNPSTFVMVDLDEDNDLDLLYTIYEAPSYSIVYYLNDGNGLFGQAIYIDANMPDYSKAFAADMDNDGDLDIVTYTYSLDKTSWYENDGSNSFGESILIADGIPQPQHMTLADLNNDGYVDLLTTSISEDEIRWVQNLGNGNFSSSVIIADGYIHPWETQAKDIDNDGDLDIIFPDTQQDNIRILANDGSGNFSIMADLEGLDSPRRVEVQDMDNDGDLDILASAYGLELGIGKFLPVMLFENLSPAGVFNYNFNGNFDISCQGDQNGSINVIPYGGQPPYTIEWTDNSLSGFNLNGLAAGVYNFTVTDDAGATFSETISITEPSSPLELSFASSPDIGAQSNGSITITPSGGTSPYSFEWNTSPVQTSSTINNLAAGNFTVSVTDANGCQQISEINVISIDEILSVNVDGFFDLLCAGDQTGIIEVIPTAGLPPYNIEWTDNSLSGFNLENLLIGEYTFTITDSTGYSINQSVTISEPAPIILNLDSSSEMDSGSNGSASVAATGGTPPFTYNWSTTPVQTTATINGLNGGTYSVTVTDANGCIESSSILVDAITATNSINTAEGFNIYPNPVKANEAFFIISPGDIQPENVRIIDELGHSLQNGINISLVDDKIKCQIKVAGIYFIEISKEDEISTTQKIIVLK